MSKQEVGIDVGGTFTDFTVYNEGNFKIYKIQTNPDDIVETLKTGLEIINFKSGHISHGTTIATNAVLERKGSKTAVITTEGFKDILAIGRQNRNQLYDINVSKPSPLVPEKYRFEVKERILHDGTVLHEVNSESIKNIIRKLKNSGIQSVAILFINSFKNSLNEKIARKILAHEKRFYVCSSSEVSNQFREYERFSTTAMNAYVAPKIINYIGKIKSVVGQSSLDIMSSAGGSLSIGDVTDRPVETILSGPAAGVIAATKFSKITRLKSLVTFDMGGTSTDVSVINNSSYSLTKNSSVSGLPIQIPQIEILTIGQGGGSVIWTDSAGILRVGPMSQGAIPGPACYGNHGKLPTITDAFVICGTLRQEYFKFKKLFPDLAHKSFYKLSRELKVPPLEIARNAIKIAAFNMSMAIRKVTIDKGHDPRNFFLLCFGGAGPLFACYLADILKLKGCLIPPYPGSFCALGALLADRIKEEVRTIFLTSDGSNQSLFNSYIKRMVGSFKGDVELLCEMRYPEQNHELLVSGKGDLEQFKRSFEQKHKRIFGFNSPDIKPVIVNLIVRKILQNSLQFPRISKVAHRQASEEHMIYPDKGASKCSFIHRNTIHKNEIIKGPAVIVEDSATTFVKSGFRCDVDKFNNLVMTRVA